MTRQHCDGCLGSGGCWVCLGTGRADTQHFAGVCGRCDGTGRCSYCPAQALLVPIPVPRQLAVLDQRGVAALYE